MKITSILFLVVVSTFFNACATSNKELKLNKKKPLIVQEMNTDHVVILSDLAPTDLNSFLSYVRSRIYRNLRSSILTGKNKIGGSVTVSFMILKNGQVNILKLSGTRNLYDLASNTVKKSFPVPVSVNKIKVSLPVKINITMDYKLYSPSSM